MWLQIRNVAMAWDTGQGLFLKLSQEENSISCVFRFTNTSV